MQINDNLNEDKELKIENFEDNKKEIGQKTEKEKDKIKETPTEKPKDEIKKLEESTEANRSKES